MLTSMRNLGVATDIGSKADKGIELPLLLAKEAHQVLQQPGLQQCRELRSKVIFRPIAPQHGVSLPQAMSPADLNACMA